MKMTLGAEPKKVMVLGGLLVVALVIFVINSSSDGNPGSSNSPAPAATSRPASSAPSAAPPADSQTAPNRSARAARSEFRPSPKPKRGEARPDPTTIDPTLRLDLLAKLQQVNVEGMHRSIFDFGQAPPPKPVEEVKRPKAPSPLIGPPPPPKPQETASAEPPKPKAPPVPFKFYGYITSQPMSKRAFFMEGEDIHVVSEGDVVKNRYKIVRIGVNSAVVEDTQFQSQQTLPLEEQPT
jgi:hypothetical protein